MNQGIINYQCQIISNDFNAKNGYKPQPLFSNQFQGENYHPNMINQMNAPFDNYQNMIRKVNYQGQINNPINIINNMNNKMNEIKEEYEYKLINVRNDIEKLFFSKIL